MTPARAGSADVAADILTVADLSLPETAGAEALVPFLRAFDATVRFTTLPAGLSGRTCWSSEGPLIEVSRDESPNRKVFTLAHEIGHLLLEEASLDLDLAFRIPRESAKVERLCDDIAGRILMPDQWVAAVAAQAMHNGHILETADHIGVSSRALIIRFEQTGFPAVMVSAMKSSDGRWTVTRKTGRLSRTRASEIHLPALKDCDLGTTRYLAPATRPEWAVKDCVVGEVRKGTRSAIIWFTEPRVPRTSGDTPLSDDCPPVLWRSSSI